VAETIVTLSTFAVLIFEVAESSRPFSAEVSWVAFCSRPIFVASGSAGLKNAVQFAAILCSVGVPPASAGVLAGVVAGAGGADGADDEAAAEAGADDGAGAGADDEAGGAAAGLELLLQAATPAQSAHTSTSCRRYI
jgi:hypothetical protein